MARRIPRIRAKFGDTIFLPSSAHLVRVRVRVRVRACGGRVRYFREMWVAVRASGDRIKGRSPVREGKGYRAQRAGL